MGLWRALSLLGALLLIVVGAAAAVAADQDGSIRGAVRYVGVPPKPTQLEISKDRDVCGVHPLYDQSLLVAVDGGIANAVITIPDIKWPAPLKPAQVNFDQKGCQYSPHVAVFRAGSMIVVINSDRILHNIHTESVVNPVLDLAQPGFKKEIEVKIAKPEVIKVTCDAHNWMEGWWYVTGNPFYTLTDGQGYYEINNVPPGPHSVRVWQEKLGMQVQQVTVKAGAAAVVDFVLAPPGK
jgi:hypothetical protein